MIRAVGSASPMMRLVAATAAFASVYFLVAVLTRSVMGDSGLAVLWPASGVYLGVMLVAPRHMWSALACGAWIGSLAAYLHAGSSLEVSVAFAVPSSAEGLLGALLVERIAGKRFRLRGLHDLFALVLGGAVAANALVWAVGRGHRGADVRRLVRGELAALVECRCARRDRGGADHHRAAPPAGTASHRRRRAGGGSCRHAPRGCPAPHRPGLLGRAPVELARAGRRTHRARARIHRARATARGNHGEARRGGPTRRTAHC